MRTLFARSPLTAGVAELEPEEARHGRTVLRLKIGDRVRLIDGAGAVAEATVEQVTRDQLRCRVGAVAQHPAGHLDGVRLVVAPPKGSRWEDMVRAVTELGVGAIAPLQCARGNPPPKLDRARRVAREACKQSRRSHLPRIEQAVAIPDMTALGAAVMVLDPAGEAWPATAREPLHLLVGPEGGLTTEERQDLLAHGARPVRLGEHILRIETAAVAACAAVAARWSDQESPA